jgi:hypothetical protein
MPEKILTLGGFFLLHECRSWLLRRGVQNTLRPLPPTDLVKTLGGEILSLSGFVNGYSNVRLTSLTLIDDVWVVWAAKIGTAAACPRCQTLLKHLLFSTY